MPTILYPNTGCLLQAGLMRTALAESKIRLFKAGEVTVTPITTAAELEAAEADFSGYPAGGLEVTAFLPPLLAPEGGYAILSGTEQFATASPTTVPNLIGGWWLEDADGVVVIACQLDNDIPMQVPGQGIPIDVRLVFPNGS